MKVCATWAIADALALRALDTHGAGFVVLGWHCIWGIFTLAHGRRSAITKDAVGADLVVSAAFLFEIDARPMLTAMFFIDVQALGARALRRAFLRQSFEVLRLGCCEACEAEQHQGHSSHGLAHLS